MESLLKDVLEYCVRGVLFCPDEKEKKKLMKLAGEKIPPGDRTVSYLYVVGYMCWLVGSVWLPVWCFGAAKPTLFSYALCYLGGAVVTELLLWGYSVAVKRSVWQILASRSVKRDAKGRVTEYRSVRWRWFLRAWGLVFLVAGICLPCGLS